MDHVSPDDDFIINPELGRAAVIRPFGIALYEMDGDIGTHRGVVGETSEAEAWVQGGDFPLNAIQIHAR